jgi:GMP synthase-like glutamine amidotransferase
MKYLKKFNEGINKPYRNKSMPHMGGEIAKPGSISIFQQDWFEKLLPDYMVIHSNPKLKKLNPDLTLTDSDHSTKYIFDKNECSIEADIVQFTYYHNGAKQHDLDIKDPKHLELHPDYVLENGEPSMLEFDIHFVKNERGVKLLVDITYGDHMACEFSIETPNKINIIHYTGIGAKYDSETHWGFADESITALCKFFNAFEHGINITESDLSFLDEKYESYHHVINNTDHLYNDTSDLIQFGNAYKESYQQNGIVLVINNAKSPQFKYFPKVARYLRVNDIPYQVAITPDDVKRISSEFNVTGAISTGSDYRMLKPEDRREYQTSEYALENLDCPILALCYGFQSMAKFYGSELSGGLEECGNFRLDNPDTSHFLFSGVDTSEIEFRFCFHDFPTSCPSGFSVISYIGDKISGISNTNLERYGTLFHPEELEETWPVFDNFIQHCKELQSDREVQKSYQLETFESFIKQIK